MNKIESVERETSSLINALARARMINRLLLLAIVILIGVFGTLFYRLGKKIQQPEYLDELRIGAEMRFFDQDQPLTEEQRHELLIAEIKAFANAAQPVVTEAVQNRIDRDKALYEAELAKQRGLLVANLQERIAKQLQNRQEEVLSQYEAILKEEFKALDDPEDPELYKRMIANFEAALQKLTKKYYIDELAAQMEQMYDRWDQFPAAEPPRGEDELESEILNALGEVLVVKLAKPAEQASPE
jgi:hypothetical protein